MSLCLIPLFLSSIHAAISGRVVSSEWLQIDVHNETEEVDPRASPEDIAWGKELVPVQKNFSIPR